MALDAIRDALAAVLNIDASKIHLECPTQRVKGNAHIIITVDTDDDETRRGVFETMSDTDAFIEMLNKKLPGTANDFRDASTPSVNTQGKEWYTERIVSHPPWIINWGTRHYVI